LEMKLENNNMALMRVVHERGRIETRGWLF
jgi:hypothetical protein